MMRKTTTMKRPAGLPLPDCRHSTETWADERRRLCNKNGRPPASLPARPPARPADRQQVLQAASVRVRASYLQPARLSLCALTREQQRRRRPPLAFRVLLVQTRSNHRPATAAACSSSAKTSNNKPKTGPLLIIGQSLSYSVDSTTRYCISIFVRQPTTAWLSSLDRSLLLRLLSQPSCCRLRFGDRQ